MESKIYTRSWLSMSADNDKGGAMMVHGYAARYNVQADLGVFREIIMKGAFDDANFSDVRFLVNHSGIPLARSTNGSLRLRVTSSGLHYAATLPETAEARELYEAIKDGRLSHSSFAFTIAEEEWEPRMKLRRITRIGEVLDVSPVSFPAYVETSVEAGPGVV